MTNIGGDSMNPEMGILALPKTNDQWAPLRAGEQGNFLSLGWETVFQGIWTVSRVTPWIYGEEMVILSHYFFWKDLDWRFSRSIPFIERKRTSEPHSVQGPTKKQHTNTNVRLLCKTSVLTTLCWCVFSAHFTVFTADTTFFTS
jgi:hypothetical protein